MFEISVPFCLDIVHHHTAKDTSHITVLVSSNVLLLFIVPVSAAPEGCWPPLSLCDTDPPVPAA